MMIYQIHPLPQSNSPPEEALDVLVGNGPKQVDLNRFWPVMDDHVHGLLIPWTATGQRSIEESFSKVLMDHSRSWYLWIAIDQSLTSDCLD